MRNFAPPFAPLLPPIWPPGWKPDRRYIHQANLPGRTKVIGAIEWHIHPANSNGGWCVLRDEHWVAYVGTFRQALDVVHRTCQLRFLTLNFTDFSCNPNRGSL